MAPTSVSCGRGCSAPACVAVVLQHVPLLLLEAVLEDRNEPAGGTARIRAGTSNSDGVQTVSGQLTCTAAEVRDGVVLETASRWIWNLWHAMDLMRWRGRLALG